MADLDLRMQYDEKSNNIHLVGLDRLDCEKIRDFLVVNKFMKPKVFTWEPPEYEENCPKIYYWPVAATWITQHFGENIAIYRERLGIEGGHNGLDIGARMNSEVRAIGDGEVIKVGWDPKGYGNYIKIRHPNDDVSLYAHLARPHVVPGRKVKAGQQIGESGSTGWSTGPHLHLEVRRDGKAIDPLCVLKK